MKHHGFITHYLDAIEAHPDADTDQIAELMFWRLTEDQILDAACAALRVSDVMDNGCALAIRTLRSLVRTLEESR